ncbi:MAG: tyrosine-type recombinase/integrase [Comamonadaceae bacterium]|nr:tyrosine-type recombinase/integrase [Comamonadaceae bacterium]
MPVIKLTAAMFPQVLHCPPGINRQELCDADLPGLYIEVRATAPGQGTYYLRYKDTTGKTCHKRIGSTADITLADARKLAKVIKGEIASGIDPKGDEKAKKAMLTYDTFFTEEYLPYVTPRKRSWKRDEELYRLRIKRALGDKKLEAITRQEIQTFHTALLAEGLSPASADHHVKLLRQSLNLAIEWDMLDKNPAAKVPLFNVDNKVEHYLDDEQLQRLLAVLRSPDSPRSVCQIALFLLSTGARLNEALSAKWADIDRQTRVWRIPATVSKSRKIRVVPLNDSALEVLAELDSEGQFEHLFVNRQTGKPYTTIMKVWSRLRLKAGLPFLRIHDLRHMYASFLVNSGRTLYEVQACLGHSDPKVTMRYSHLSSKSMQEAANSASVAIQRGMPPNMTNGSVAALEPQAA